MKVSRQHLLKQKAATERCGIERWKYRRRCIQKYLVQKDLMQADSHCNSSIIPQPRKANHAIITDTINAASK